ncbi:aldehyde dehydrogenase family protein [Paraburkholderia tuberum]|uniref:aldehyde dehydrogenase family protein n=1 Tax=Paraburkholderia tuberum TaxID=157910 RepID=UPI000AA2AC22|nr:aldehyde dehydrogenase family protein [Paraburkholderia tuberum]
MNASRWIAGEWTGTPTLDSIDPATGEAIGQFADGGADEADAAIAAARHGFDRTTWAQDARLRQDVLLGAGSGHAFLSPTLVEHGDPKAFFCQDEIFGLFVTLEVFESEQEALEKANDTVFGLSASVWTHDGARALRTARALRNGTVWINDHN